MTEGLGERFRAHGETILLVDDELSVRKIAESLLLRLNFKPVIAVDGIDAIAKVAAHCGELRAVITDIHMPHMDGLKFIRSLRQMMPSVPVIVASGYLDDQALADLKQIGVAGRLDKPFTESQLVDMLKPLMAAPGWGDPTPPILCEI
jgi:CheY-like chemotaxis protein